MPAGRPFCLVSWYPFLSPLVHDDQASSKCNKLPSSRNCLSQFDKESRQKHGKHPLWKFYVQDWTDIPYFFLNLADKWDDPGPWGIPCLNNKTKNFTRNMSARTLNISLQIPAEIIDRQCAWPQEIYWQCVIHNQGGRLLRHASSSLASGRRLSRMSRQPPASSPASSPSRYGPEWRFGIRSAETSVLRQINQNRMILPIEIDQQARNCTETKNHCRVQEKIHEMYVTYLGNAWLKFCVGDLNHWISNRLVTQPVQCCENVVDLVQDKLPPRRLCLHDLSNELEYRQSGCFSKT